MMQKMDYHRQTAMYNEYAMYPINGHPAYSQSHSSQESHYDSYGYPVPVNYHHGRDCRCNGSHGCPYTPRHRSVSNGSFILDDDMSMSSSPTQILSLTHGTGSQYGYQSEHYDQYPDPGSGYKNQVIGDNKIGERRRVPCEHKDCLDQNGNPAKYFSRKADVIRHHKSHHERTYQDCPKRRCDRKGPNGFTRNDHLLEHLRGYHGENIPKRNSTGGLGSGDDSPTQHSRGHAPYVPR